MRINYCGNEIEINLEIGEVVTLAKLNKEAFATNWLIDGEQGIDFDVALENRSHAYMLEELEDTNVKWYLDIGFTQDGETNGYNTEVKIDYVNII